MKSRGNRFDKAKKAGILLLLLLTLFRLAMYVRMPYYIIGNSGYDDRYFLETADSILSGEWLGQFGHTTLIKGIAYPLFVVAANLLCIPYPMLLGLFNIGAVMLFIWTLSHITNNRVLIYGGYTFLLYSPVSFIIEMTGRLHRNAIIFPSVILVLSCLLMVYYQRGTKKQLPWLFALGCAFTFFYHNREDSVWLLPLVIGGLCLTAIWNLFFLKAERLTKICRTVVLAIPLAVFLLGSFAIAYKNYTEYGVLEINDRTQGPFAELTGNIMSIQHREDIRGDIDYWMPRETLERVVDVCPSLKKDKEMIMSCYQGWADETGNVKGDLSTWALRIAFDRLGYFQSAKTFNAYCEQANRELVSAIEQGQLVKDRALHFSSQSRGILPNEMMSLFSQTALNIWNVLSFSKAKQGYIESSGTEEEIRFMESITSVSSLHPTGEGEISDPNVKYSERIIGLSDVFIGVGKIISLLLCLLSIVAFIFFWIKFAVQRKWTNFEPAIIMTGILASIFIFEFGVTVFNGWLGNTWFYSIGAMPLGQCFEIISVFYLYSILLHRGEKYEINK